MLFCSQEPPSLGCLSGCRGPTSSLRWPPGWRSPPSADRPPGECASLPPAGARARMISSHPTGSHVLAAAVAFLLVSGGPLLLNVAVCTADGIGSLLQVYNTLSSAAGDGFGVLQRWVTSMQALALLINDCPCSDAPLDTTCMAKLPAASSHKVLRLTSMGKQAPSLASDELPSCGRRVQAKSYCRNSQGFSWPVTMAIT